MAEGKIRVKFDAQGDKALIDAIRRLNRETKKLAGSTANYNRTGQRTPKINENTKKSFLGLGGTLSVLRSKLLLAAFAFKSVQGVMNFARTSVNLAASFEALETRLVSMTGSTEKASEMMENFRDIASTTPFAVQDVVEAGVQLRAFGVDAEKMIKPVTDLAAFMGTTATEAASALGRAFAGGAGAADILRERGILQLIKDSQGIEDLSKITLPEFRRSLESALIDPTAGIVGATDKLSKTTVGAFSNMTDSLQNLMANFAESSGILEGFVDTARGITNVANALNKLSTGKTTEDLQNAFSEDMSNGVDIFTIALERAKSAGVEFENNVTLPLTERMSALSKAIQNTEFEKNFFGGISRQANLAKDMISELDDNVIKIDESLMAFRLSSAESFKMGTEPLGEQNELFEKLKQNIQEISEAPHNITFFETLAATFKKNNGEMDKFIQNSVSIGRSINHIGMAAQKSAEQFVTSKIQEAIASYISNFLKTTPIPPFIAAPLAIAGAGAFGSVMQQTINSASKLKFEQGGLVGGRRHSQGGTMIEAERGEFVMSRNAVSAIGVENLNRMNQGQSSGGGSINININGGMISPDFVENELAESIREAVRRGADFGIS